MSESDHTSARQEFEERLEAEAEVEELLDQAELALSNSDPQAALTACQSALVLSPRQADAFFLMGESFSLMGQIEIAIDHYRQCVLISPDFSIAWAALGHSHMLRLEWEESKNAFNRALREDPSNAEAWQGRAILRERRSDFSGADRDLARAARLDPEHFPYPLPLTDEEVESIVEETLKTLHPHIRDYLANVAILLDEIPSDDVLEQFDPPASPAEILGFFSGASLMERTTENPWTNLPSAIVLFRRNLSRHARNHEHLLEELRVTLYHEVGHFLGLDEEELKERGLE